MRYSRYGVTEEWQTSLIEEFKSETKEHIYKAGTHRCMNSDVDGIKDGTVQTPAEWNDQEAAQPAHSLKYLLMMINLNYTYVVFIPNQDI